MANKSKSRSRSGTKLVKSSVRKSTNKGAVRGGKSNILQNPTEKQKRKRKTVSQTPQLRRRSKRLKIAQNTSSLELISVIPCCSSDQEKKKYAKLGLDSALFMLNPKPAKRRQSHISVITISSSDEEDDNKDKTANWVSSINLDTSHISNSKEPFPSGDLVPWQDESISEDILEAEKIRPQRSMAHVNQSGSLPFYDSTPQEKFAMFQPICFSTPQDNQVASVQSGNSVSSLPDAAKCNLLTYAGPSFLENPLRILNSTNLSKIERPHAITSVQLNPKEVEKRDCTKPDSTQTKSEFYFGTLQASEPEIEKSDLGTPLWCEFKNLNSLQTLNDILKTESKEHDNDSITHGLQKITSLHPTVSNSILEENCKSTPDTKNNSSEK